MGIPPLFPLSYLGTSTPIPYALEPGDSPTTSDFQFNIPTVWVDSDNYKAWIILGRPQKTAKWSLFSGPNGAVLEFTVPSGTSPVYPSDGSVAFTAGSGMTITGGTNTIAFSATGGSYSWNSVATSTQTVAAQNMYVVDNGSTLVTFSLPASGSLGDSFGLVGYSSGGWAISLSSGQSIIFGSDSITTSLSSSIQSNTVFISCIVATSGGNTIWKVMNCMGNLTYVV